MKVLITGASGTLGQDLKKTFESQGDTVIGTDRDTLDITNPERIANNLDTHHPDLLVNAAAYNFVDVVEDPATYPIAEAVNGKAPGFLARAAVQRGIPFIHYSTDYVFAGSKPEGYTEDDIPDPLSAYGKTKAMGERAVQEAGGQWYILRLSKIFGTPGLTDQSKPSFVHLMMKLSRELPELKIVNEEVGCPSYTKDIAQATAELVARADAPGMYHVVNEGAGVTWYEFAKEIFEIAKVTTPSIPVRASAFPPRPAARPAFAALLNTKLPNLRHRRDALREFLETERFGV
ncbi:dTDP-4-dehydrorhamnose reductase [Candidatus Uhrbacteria bacterium]|nr:dTDP-4-dehydrorhamnose reductase [Candidatus Uhrbacteria bacterium]